MASLERASTELGSQVQWLDFDRMLTAMEAGLRQACDHLRLAASDNELESLTTGPLMTQYSKAPKHGYSPGLRRDLLSDANLRFGADIDRAMDWMKAGADRHEALGAALARAG